MNRPELRTRFGSLTDEVANRFLKRLRVVGKKLRRVPRVFTYTGDVDDVPAMTAFLMLVASMIQGHIMVCIVEIVVGAFALPGRRYSADSEVVVIQGRVE